MEGKVKIIVFLIFFFLFLIFKICLKLIKYILNVTSLYY